MHSLRFRNVTISWLNHTPHASAVYASCSALLPPHATLASQAACYGLTWAGLAPADRASFGWRLRISRPLFPTKADVDRASAGCTVGQGRRPHAARNAAQASSRSARPPVRPRVGAPRLDHDSPSCAPGSARRRHGNTLVLRPKTPFDELRQYLRII